MFDLNIFRGKLRKHLYSLRSLDDTSVVEGKRMRDELMKMDGSPFMMTREQKRRMLKQELDGRRKMDMLSEKK